MDNMDWGIGIGVFTYHLTPNTSYSNPSGVVTDLMLIRGVRWRSLCGASERLPFE